MPIFKYPLALSDVQDVPMPKGARILTAQAQGGRPVLWAVVDDPSPSSVMEKRRIFLHITGSGGPATADIYINTVQLPGGFVAHVFEAAA